MLQTFSIGVLVNQECVLQAWEIKMLQDCIKNGLVKKITLIVLKQKLPLKKNKIFVSLFQKFENFWFTNKENAFTKVFIRNNKWVNEFVDADELFTTSPINFDLIYLPADTVFDEQYIRFTKYGLWRIEFGQNKYYASALPAFWEVMDHSPVTGSHLLVYNKEVSPVRVYNCSTVTVPYSVKNNFNSIAWKSSSFLAYRLYELSAIGTDSFFKKYDLLQITDAKPLTQPANFQMIFLFLRNNIRYLLYKIGTLQKKRFTIAYSTDNFNILAPDFKKFRKLKLPKSTFYADPFLIEHEQKKFIFFENFNQQKGKADISVFLPNETIKPVLELTCHISYPFIFEWKDSFWMIPETVATKNVQLYRCTQFPDKWEFVKELMSDCILIDATVFFHNNKWWMFGVTQNHPQCNSNDQLILYFTDDLLEGEWINHPQNPIATDIANCRPAGKVFEQNGKLYRPAQNNASFQYGFGICINEIEVLTETMYREKLLIQYLPNVNAPYKAIHTINQSDNFTVIDAIF